MNIFTCNKCTKSFKLKTDLDRHNNRKFSCINSIKYDENTKKPKCYNCDKIYSTKHVFLTHICKINKKIDTPIKNNIAEINKLKEQIKVLEAEEEQNKKIKIINNNNNNINGNNNSNNNNINNTNIVNNIHIQMLPFENSNDFLNSDELKKVIRRGYKSLEDYIVIKHFNKEHPENHNIYISNNRDKYVNVYDGKLWNLQEKNDIIDKLYDDNSEYLIEQFIKLSDELDRTIILKFGKFKNDYEGDGNLECIKNNIKLLLYNNRKIIEDTKKLQQKQSINLI